MLAKSVYVTCRLISVFNYTYIFVVEVNGPRCILCNKTLGKGDEASFVTVFLALYTLRSWFKSVDEARLKCLVKLDVG